MCSTNSARHLYEAERVDRQVDTLGNERADFPGQIFLHGSWIAQRANRDTSSCGIVEALGHVCIVSAFCLHFKPERALRSRDRIARETLLVCEYEGTMSADSIR